MKIYKLYEFLDIRAIRQLKKSKRSHSRRVAELTKQLSFSFDVYDAAYYHDYLEDVGDRSVLDDILSFRSYILVDLLTIPDDVDPLQYLKIKMESISSDLKEDIIIIKLCDRTDNLLRRKKNGELKNKYIHKSADLINYLYKTSNNKKDIEIFIKSNIFHKIPKLRKYITFD